MMDIKIALVGQPNTGKSSLLNSLAGARAIVSNYPGTTVEITKTKIKMDTSLIEIMDTPGVYSIFDASSEEIIVEKVVFEEDIDGSVIMVDATVLERGLNLVLQILEAGVTAIIVLNSLELYRASRYHVQSCRLNRQ
ncbi:MAG: GTP-binding protein [Candidatus Kuenenia sp.]|nr:GTP-binding protein [Candidatus Kuenenia hertensis]